MVFDLNATSNLPQSSTSSCTDYFFDGCHSKYTNKCDNQYQNCQCRPCCINSMINDHTYTLLKKICRKVIKDYQRQQSRERYTIFEGGNSINVRIHRSSFEDGRCKHVSGNMSSSTLRETQQKDRKDAEHRADNSLLEKSGMIRSKKKGKVDDADGVGAKQRDGLKSDQKSGKYDPSGVGQNKRKKGRDIENADEKQRKVKRKGEDDDDDGKDRYDGGKRGKGAKYGGTIDDQNNEPSGKRKGKKTEYIDKDRNGDAAENKKAAIKRNVSEGDGEGRHGSKVDGETVKKKSDKSKQRKDTKENDKEHTRRKSGEINKHKSGEDEVSEKVKKKTSHEDKTREGSNKYNAGDTMNGRKRSREESSTKGFKGKSKEQDSDPKFMQANREKSHKKDLGHILKKGRVTDESDNTISNRKLAAKGKSIRDLPVISDLRAKVRRGHDISPFKNGRPGKTGSRSSLLNQGGRKYNGPREKQDKKGNRERAEKQYRSTSKKRRSRTARGTGLRLTRHYRTTTLSRSDEVRPCDILRAHMEQRELCERQRVCCLTCPCDCSAVYCQAPSTICSHLY